MGTAKLKYFLPWWPSDYVLNGWMPQHDLTRKPEWEKKYFWDDFPGRLDGILVSRMAVKPGKVRTLRRDIRFDGVIIGDSGAHTNAKLAEPPYSCEHLMEYYALGGFDYGMHLDVVAAPWVVKGGLSRTELEGRQLLTLRNAERCLHILDKEKYTFELIGVVQGWDEASYLDSFRALLQLGFGYVAIAGQKHLPLIAGILRSLHAHLQKTGQQVKLHVLGTGNPKIIPLYLELGLCSFDSATWLRYAWLGPNNYYLVEGCDYRVLTTHRPEGYPLSPEVVLPEITCDCPCCSLLKQDILVFRGHERNTRRGYHNIHQYLRYLDHWHQMRNSF